jgi:hypothetical protein
MSLPSAGFAIYSTYCPYFVGGEDMRLRSWLRHYATSWKVAGSFPEEFIGFIS